MAAGNGRRIPNVERFLNTLRFPFGGYRFRLFPGADFLSFQDGPDIFLPPVLPGSIRPYNAFQTRVRCHFGA